MVVIGVCRVKHLHVLVDGALVFEVEHQVLISALLFGFILFLLFL